MTFDFPVSQDTGPIEAKHARRDTVPVMPFRCHKTPAPLKRVRAQRSKVHDSLFPVSQDTGPIEAQGGNLVQELSATFRCLKTPAPLKRARVLAESPTCDLLPVSEDTGPDCAEPRDRNLRPSAFPVLTRHRPH